MAETFGTESSESADPAWYTSLFNTGGNRMQTDGPTVVQLDPKWCVHLIAI